jgi:hypothetical protein
MPSTLLLDTALWDLVLDANGNIAVASQPYSLAQDAASAIKTFLGECYYDTTIGVPYLTQIFGVSPPPLTQIKQALTNAALTVPNVASAQVFITSFTNRVLSGQVQVVASNTAQVSAVTFSVTNPQGVG